MGERRHAGSAWTPDAALLDALPPGQLLLDPTGRNHLYFVTERGEWNRLLANRRLIPLSVTSAIAARAADIDIIVKVTVVWVIRSATLAGLPSTRGSALLDDLAAGAKTAVLHYADMAGVRRTRA